MTRREDIRRVILHEKASGNNFGCNSLGKEEQLGTVRRGIEILRWWNRATTKRHEEMERAIENELSETEVDIGEAIGCVYTQIHRDRTVNACCTVTQI